MFAFGSYFCLSLKAVLYSKENSRYSYLSSKQLLLFAVGSYFCLSLKAVLYSNENSRYSYLSSKQLLLFAVAMQIIGCYGNTYPSVQMVQTTLCVLCLRYHLWVLTILEVLDHLKVLSHLWRHRSTIENTLLQCGDRI